MLQDHVRRGHPERAQDAGRRQRSGFRGMSIFPTSGSKGASVCHVSPNARKSTIFEAIFCRKRERTMPANPGGTTVSDDFQFFPAFSPQFSPEMAKKPKRKRERDRRFECAKTVQKRENPHEHWVSRGSCIGGGGGIRTHEGFHPT